VLPLVAVGLLIFAVTHVMRAQQAPPPASPPVDPPRTPFNRTVAGSGIIEPRTENISIGAPLPGVVTEVLVKVGDELEAGAPLFKIDDRQVKADLKSRHANLAAAKAELSKLESQPRPEELPAALAKVNEAKASLEEQRSNYDRLKKLVDRGVVTDQEIVTRRQAVEVGEQQVAAAQAQYDLLKAGAWEPDKRLARVKVEQAEAEVAMVQTQLERLQVSAPVKGEVLQVNVRPGEFVGSQPGQALIVFGNVQQMHVRADVDEHDIPRFRPDAPAKAVLRGDPRQEFKLKFYRVEPYVTPKKSLTGDNTERVDTRVLQVIYEIAPGPVRLYVGQQVDVFIEAAPNAPDSQPARAATTGEASGQATGEPSSGEAKR
ncbi:MAG TPA: efflux RND transporter periplasmic adaptor subunit, partial [Pirellulales bacterium]